MTRVGGVTGLCALQNVELLSVAPVVSIDSGESDSTAPTEGGCVSITKRERIYRLMRGARRSATRIEDANVRALPTVGTITSVRPPTR